MEGLGEMACERESAVVCAVCAVQTDRQVCMCYDVYLISVSYPSIAYPYHIKTQSHNYPAAHSPYRHHHPIYPSLSPSSQPATHLISPAPIQTPSTAIHTHTSRSARLPLPHPPSSPLISPAPRPRWKFLSPHPPHPSPCPSRKQTPKRNKYPKWAAVASQVL
jgi:hypothetical protein